MAKSKAKRKPEERREKSVLHRLTNGEGKLFGYMIWCEGCGCGHAFYTEAPEGIGGKWKFNGNIESPTFTPSMLVTSGHYITGHTGRCWCDVQREEPERKNGFECIRCHSFVTDGKIQYLADCTHKLANQTVPLKTF